MNRCPISYELCGKNQYAATGGAKTSAHMLAEACDLPIEKQDELILQIRADIQAKGIIFQHLFELGYRGFGIYDTFIHLDTVPIPLYPTFATKRKSTHTKASFMVIGMILRSFGCWSLAQK